MGAELDLEFEGKVSFQRLTSLEEDRKREQAEMRQDKLNREKKRTAESRSEVHHLSYERFPEENQANP